MRGFGVAIGVFSLSAGIAAAQATPAATTPAPAARQARMSEALKDYHGPEYVRTEVMIPTRDGAKLHTIILRPADSEKTGPPLPFLMTRTPYGVDGASPSSVKLGKRELAESGYIYVDQDIRGRYKSEGQFVMNRPVVDHKTKNDVDETTDTHDTIDWLLKNVPNNNGRVGVVGVSYPGFTAMMAGIDAHPAVKAISPQAPMTNIWLGDDFFHNGAFRETYGFDYVKQLEAQKTDVRADSKQDQYDFFLNHVNFEGAAEAGQMTELPTAKIFLSQPSYVKFWQDMAVEPHLHRPEVPTLEVGGYWDQEDMWGTQAEYAALRPNEPADETDKTTGPHKVYMVLGPWNHGGWSRGPGDELGGKFGTVKFSGEKTGEYYRSKIEFPFFEFYLKDKPGFDLKDTASFRSGENKWHRYEVWPPKQGFHHVTAFLAKDGVLREATAAELQPYVGRIDPAKWNESRAVATYVADPASPVPYRHRPVQSTYGDGSVWRTWLVEDQKFVSGRKDLANFSTPVLQKDLTVTGDVVANIEATTTGTDADWIVKLIDVYPESEGGYQLMVGEEILRGRYRKSFTNPEPVKPGEPTEYRWSLHGVDHTFLRGHKMMVEVQSSWFPLYDRNPQTYVENIMKAPASAYKAETVTILGGSHIDLPMADGNELP
jgi:putative CocE/NonD family hydrolase